MQKQKDALDQIFNTQSKTIDVMELKRMIQSSETEYELLLDGVDSLNKLISEGDENHKALESFNENEMKLFAESLLRLKLMLMHTVYEIKIRDIMKLPKLKIVTTEYDKEEINRLKGLQTQGIVDNCRILNGKFSNIDTLFHFVHQEMLPLMSQRIISINAHHTRYSIIHKFITFLCNLFHQTELEVRIQKNTLIENRIFVSRYDLQIQCRASWILQKMGIIINEALLCPSDMGIQGELFKLLRRLYGLWNQKIYTVLFLNIRNISLYSNNSETQEPLIKEVSMFLYKTIHAKSDIKLVDLLEKSDDLHFLKESQFYNSKAFAYSNEYTRIYDINLDQLPFLWLQKKIGSRETWTRVVVINKPNSLLAWQFSLANYDIKFGIFKVTKGKRYSIEEYESKTDCKPIVKLQKYGEAGDKKKMKGSVFVKNGVYHVVFDNSYSMVRGKDINYYVKELQSIM